MRKICRRAGRRFSIGSPPAASFSTGLIGTVPVLNTLISAFPLVPGSTFTPITPTV